MSLAATPIVKVCAVFVALGSALIGACGDNGAGRDAPFADAADGLARCALIVRDYVLEALNAR